MEPLSATPWEDEDSSIESNDESFRPWLQMKDTTFFYTPMQVVRLSPSFKKCSQKMEKVDTYDGFSDTLRTDVIFCGRMSAEDVKSLPLFAGRSTSNCKGLRTPFAPLRSAFLCGVHAERACRARSAWGGAAAAQRVRAEASAALSMFYVVALSDVAETHKARHVWISTVPPSLEVPRAFDMQQKILHSAPVKAILNWWWSTLTNDASHITKSMYTWIQERLFRVLVPFGTSSPQDVLESAEDDWVADLSLSPISLALREILHSPDVSPSPGPARPAHNATTSEHEGRASGQADTLKSKGRNMPRSKMSATSVAPLSGERTPAPAELTTMGKPCAPVEAIVPSVPHPPGASLAPGEPRSLINGEGSGCGDGSSGGEGQGGQGSGCSDASEDDGSPVVHRGSVLSTLGPAPSSVSSYTLPRWEDRLTTAECEARGPSPGEGEGARAAMYSPQAATPTQEPKMPRAVFERSLVVLAATWCDVSIASLLEKQAQMMSGFDSHCERQAKKIARWLKNALRVVSPEKTLGDSKGLSLEQSQKRLMAAYIRGHTPLSKKRQPAAKIDNPHFPPSSRSPSLPKPRKSPSRSPTKRYSHPRPKILRGRPGVSPSPPPRGSFPGSPTPHLPPLHAHAPSYDPAITRDVRLDGHRVYSPLPPILSPSPPLRSVVTPQTPARRHSVHVDLDVRWIGGRPSSAGNAGHKTAPWVPRSNHANAFLSSAKMVAFSAPAPVTVSPAPGSAGQHGGHSGYGVPATHMGSVGGFSPNGGSQGQGRAGPLSPEKLGAMMAPPSATWQVRAAEAEAKAEEARMDIDASLSFLNPALVAGPEEALRPAWFGSRRRPAASLRELRMTSRGLIKTPVRKDDRRGHASGDGIPSVRQNKDGSLEKIEVDLPRDENGVQPPLFAYDSRGLCDTKSLRGCGGGYYARPTVALPIKRSYKVEPAGKSLKPSKGSSENIPFLAADRKPSKGKEPDVSVLWKIAPEFESDVRSADAEYRRALQLLQGGLTRGALQVATQAKSRYAVRLGGSHLKTAVASVLIAAIYANLHQFREAEDHNLPAQTILLAVRKSLRLTEVVVSSHKQKRQAVPLITLAHVLAESAFTSGMVRFHAEKYSQALLFFMKAQEYMPGTWRYVEYAIACGLELGVLNQPERRDAALHCVFRFVRMGMIKLKVAKSSEEDEALRGQVASWLSLAGSIYSRQGEADAHSAYHQEDAESAVHALVASEYCFLRALHVGGQVICRGAIAARVHLARFYMTRRADPETSVVLLRCALQLSGELGGQTNAPYIRCLHDLALAYLACGRLSEGIAALERVQLISDDNEYLSKEWKLRLDQLLCAVQSGRVPVAGRRVSIVKTEW